MMRYWMMMFSACLALSFPSGAQTEERDDRFYTTTDLMGGISGSADATSGSVDTSAMGVDASLDSSGAVGFRAWELHWGNPWVVPEFGVGGAADFAVGALGCGVCDGIGVDLEGSVTAQVKAGWLTGHYRETYQRPVTFDDDYWRDETGTIRRTVGVHLPGVFHLLQPDEYEAYFLAVLWERRELFEAGLERYFRPDRRLGDEHHWDVTLGGGAVFDGETAMRFSIVNIDYTQHVVPTPAESADTHLYPLYETPADGSIRAFDYDISAIEFQRSAPAPGLNHLQVGWSYRRPASLSGPYEQGEWSSGIDYALGVGQSLSRDYVPGWERIGKRQPRLNQFGWQVEVSDFHRIDSTGLAADRGDQITADAAYGGLAGWTFSARAAGALARRQVVSPLLAGDAELPAMPGDRLLIGRLEAQIDWAIDDVVTATFNSWVERSDRAGLAQPGERRSAVIPLDTNFGAWVGLSARPF